MGPFGLGVINDMHLSTSIQLVFIEFINKKKNLKKEGLFYHLFKLNYSSGTEYHDVLTFFLLNMFFERDVHTCISWSVKECLHCFSREHVLCSSKWLV